MNYSWMKVFTTILPNIGICFLHLKWCWFSVEVSYCLNVFKLLKRVNVFLQLLAIFIFLSLPFYLFGSLDDIHIFNGDLYMYYSYSLFLIFDIKVFIPYSIIFVKFLFRVYIYYLVESADLCNPFIASILVNLVLSSWEAGIK